MGKLAKDRIPTLRLHRASGRAVVTLGGVDYYCGEHGTPEAEAKYRRLVAEWLANGRRMPAKGRGPAMGELADRYEAWAKGRFVKRGRETSHMSKVRAGLRGLRSLYGDVGLEDFGPLALRALRTHWLEMGLARTTVAGYAAVVVEMVRWAVAEELAPEGALGRLRAVRGLTQADGGKEGRKVLPAPPGAVEAVLGALPAKVADALRLMLVTGMRPAEALGIRPADVERSGAVWTYRVQADWDKTTAKRPGARVVGLGPRAQAIAGPWLEKCRTPEAYAFAGRGGRPVQVASVCSMVRKACARLGVEHWSPNRLRHNHATLVRARFGLEAAQAVLGHARPDTTLVYAERDLEAIRKVAAELG